MGNDCIDAVSLFYSVYKFSWNAQTPGRSRVLRFDLSRHWDYFKRASGSFLQHEVDSSSVLLFLFFVCFFVFFHLAHSRTSNLLEDLLRHGSITNVSSF